MRARRLPQGGPLIITFIFSLLLSESIDRCDYQPDKQISSDNFPARAAIIYSVTCNFNERGVMINEAKIEEKEKRRNEAEERMERPKWSRRNAVAEWNGWYSGWLASVGVDVARLRLDSPRVAWPSPSSSPPVNPTTVSPSLSLSLSLSLSRNPFHFSLHIPSPSISPLPLLFPLLPPFYLVLVSFFLSLFSPPALPRGEEPYLSLSFSPHFRSVPTTTTTTAAARVPSRDVAHHLAGIKYSQEF